jgi:hypothetical protein
MRIYRTASPSNARKALMGLGFAALGLAFLMPGHYPPWLSFEPQLIAAFGFGCVLTGLCAELRGGSLSPGLPGWVALSLTPLPLIQYAVGQIGFLSDALLPALYLSGLALTVIYSRNAAPARRQEVTELLFMSLTLAAGVSAAFAWSQWLQQYPIPFTNPTAPDGRVYANLGQPNHLATLLALGCVGVFRAHAKAALSGPTAALVLAWLSTSLVMTQSRTGWLEVALIGVWMGFLGRSHSRSVPVWAIVLWTAAFAALVLGWDSLNTFLLRSPDSLAERLEGSARLQHWADMWAAALERPWFGYGWNQVGIAQLATVSLASPPGEMVTNSHNTALDLVVWCGLPIGLTVVALLLLWTVRRLKAGLDQEQGFLMLTFLLVGIHALVEYPLDYTYLLLPWALFIGLLDSPTKIERGPRLPWVATATLLCCSALLVIWIAIEYLKVDAATRDARLASIPGLRHTEPWPQPPQVVLLDGLRELHRLVLTPARADMTAADLQWMRTVTDRYPLPPLLLRDALAAGLNGQPERALRRLEQLCAIHGPTHCMQAEQQWHALRQRYTLPQPSSWPRAAHAPKP